MIDRGLKPLSGRRIHSEPDAAEAVSSRRSGPPLPGCDCMQCFGYCLVNQEVALRERVLRREGSDCGIPLAWAPDRSARGDFDVKEEGV